MKLHIDGPVGQLEGIFDTSPTPAEFAALVLHPHPVYGGTMHNRVVVRIVRALQSVGADVLRINFRGVGESRGSYDGGVGERADAQAALEYLKAESPGLPLVVAGFSFGCWVGFRIGVEDRDVRGLLGAGMSLKHFDFDFLRPSPLPKWIVQGEFDEFGAGETVKPFVESCREPRGFSQIDGADHFFTDHIEDFSRELARAAAWLKAGVVERFKGEG